MADKTSQVKEKRKSKSHRTYVRRLKQAARTSGMPYHEPSKPAVKEKK
jgi:hypothetical protein